MGIIGCLIAMDGPDAVMHSGVQKAAGFQGFQLQWGFRELRNSFKSGRFRQVHYRPLKALAIVSIFQRSGGTTLANFILVCRIISVPQDRVGVNNSEVVYL